MEKNAVYVHDLWAYITFVTWACVVDVIRFRKCTQKSTAMLIVDVCISNVLLNFVEQTFFDYDFVLFVFYRWVCFVSFDIC